MTKKNSPDLIKNKKVRFVVVGGTNTAIDFVLYNLLSKVFALALPIANMISSFIAMIFSFFTNKKWTFHDASENYFRQIVLFFIFTIIGLWVIQTGIIWLTQNIFPSVDWQNFWLKNILKIVASIPSLIWNYITYNKFVFRKTSRWFSLGWCVARDPRLRYRTRAGNNRPKLCGQRDVRQRSLVGVPLVRQFRELV